MHIKKSSCSSECFYGYYGALQNVLFIYLLCQSYLTFHCFDYKAFDEILLCNVNIFPYFSPRVSCGCVQLSVLRSPSKSLISVSSNLQTDLLTSQENAKPCTTSISLVGWGMFHHLGCSIKQHVLTTGKTL